MLTAFAEPDLLFAAMQAGAVGYLLKHTPAAELVATLRRIVAGEHVLDARPRLALPARVPARASARPAGPRCAQLSPREEEVLRLLATGETNRQIARRLFVSEETVKSHVAAIFRKLEVSDRTRAAVLAVRAGLVDALAAAAGPGGALRLAALACTSRSRGSALLRRLDRRRVAASTLVVHRRARRSSGRSASSSPRASRSTCR